jgi:transposase
VNVLKPHLQSTVFTLLERNRSQREIERLTGVDRKTIRRYQAIFESQKLAAANSPTAAITGSEPTQPALAQIPPLPRSSAPAVPSKAATFNFARSASEPYREWIEEQVRLRRNAQAIYQDLVDQFGFTASYQSVRRFVQALRHVDPQQFDRLEAAPGEEAQVDYGEGALTRDPKSGRYRRPRLFVMTLRYSRRSFRRVVWKSSKQVWAQLHEEAFRYFGGAVSYVVLDNLREGVIRPDLYEPEINRLYGAMLEHYGAIADPARVRDPKIARGP